MIQYAHLLEEQYVLLNKEIPMRRYDEELLRTLHEYIRYQKLNGQLTDVQKNSQQISDLFFVHIEGKELSICTFRAWADRKSRGRKH